MLSNNEQDEDESLTQHVHILHGEQQVYVSREDNISLAISNNDNDKLIMIWVVMNLLISRTYNWFMRSF